MSSLSYTCKNTSEMPMNFFNVSKFDFEQIWNFYIKNKMISISYTPSPVNIMDGYVEEENSFMLELEEKKLPRNEWIYFTHTLKINGEFRDRTEGYMMAVADGDDEDDIIELKFKKNKKVESEKLVGMTVWMLDDTECNYGRFCWFDTVYEARKRFEERKGEWCSALIEFKGDAVFAIDRLPCPVCGENEFPSPKRDWCDECEEERITKQKNIKKNKSLSKKRLVR